MEGDWVVGDAGAGVGAGVVFGAEFTVEDDEGGPGDPDPEFGGGPGASLSPCFAVTAKTRHDTSKKSFRRIRRPLW